MTHTSMILSAIMMMAFVVFMAPNIFALNKGHILRNIALWLAIFLGLAVFYQTFGPQSPHPLFQMPPSMTGMHKETEPQWTPSPSGKDDSDTGTQGFTPPKE